MLYDPRWEKTKTKPDVLSLAGLIAWLETMPADGAYRYSDSRGGCVLCQYLTARGASYLGGGYGRFLTSALRVEIAAGGAQTFGEALVRAKAIAR